jgi:hypothetical protein
MLGSVNLGLGSVPLAGDNGSGGSGTGVLTVQGTNGITVDNTDPQNPIVKLTGYPLVTGYLAQLYALGVIDNPITRNTLVGTQFKTFFAPQGYVEISQTDNPALGSYDLRLRRHDIATQGTNRPQFALYTFFDFVGGLNTTGGTGFDSILEDAAGNDNLFSQYQAQLDIVNGSWYRPQFESAAKPVTISRFLQVNRRNIGVQSNWYVNSDGCEWIVGRFPGATPLQLGHVWSMDFGDDGGPVNGSAYGVRVTGPAAAGPGIFQSAEIGSWFFVLDDQNFGSRQAIGHFELYLSGPALGTEHILSLQVFPPNDAIKSTADAAALSYDTTADRLRLSNNAGAYSPVATLADLTPSAALVGIVVDVPSSQQDAKSITTFTALAAQAGKKFLPIAAYVELVNVAVMTVGPSIKLGNNGAHDNVAGVLAVLSTAVTGDAPPFVMAASPSIIDLTTEITAELTANASATTCDIKIHLIGVYVA